MTAPQKPDAKLYVSRLVHDDDKAIASEDAANIAGSFLTRVRRRVQEARQERDQKDVSQSKLEKVR